MSVHRVPLSAGWLREREDVAAVPGTRSFLIREGGSYFELTVRHVPDSALENFTHVEQPAQDPADGEVLGVIAQAFLGSLPGEGGLA